LAADPGTRFGYDGASIELAARVVEVVSGMSFDRFLRERIFQPLRMHDTGFEVPADQRAQHAHLRLPVAPRPRRHGAPRRCPAVRT
jgi:CubicO group peptidase (beta-lactamase class C family)